jgi:hypothetical protein
MVEFLFWKLVVFVALAFVWGIFCGATGRRLTGERIDTAAKEPDPNHR